MFKEKLIALKQQWAKQKRSLSGQPSQGRLPPGQHRVVKWPVLDLGIVPQISLERWELTVDGLVEKPLRLSWEEFRALPTITKTTDIHCVTTWSLYDNQWQGVSAQHLLEMVKVKPEACHVLFSSYDGYTTNVPLSVFQDDDVLLAFDWNGAPIPPEHGGPLRIVIPKIYLWKSAKWIHRIHFTPTDQPGFWETRGYHNHADPWKEQRYSSE